MNTTPSNIDATTGAAVIVGAGQVGTAIARGMTAAGIPVELAVRNPAETRDELADLTLRPLDAPIADAQCIILAVPASAIADVVAQLDLIDGHVVIDATNAVRTPPPDGFPTVGAYVRSLLPTGVHLAKAFNTIGAEHLSTGRLGGAPAFLPLAGDPQACAVATSIGVAIGFETADLGGPEMIEMVEDHARLWIHLALSAGWGRNFGFAVTRT